MSQTSKLTDTAIAESLRGLPPSFSAAFAARATARALLSLGLDDPLRTAWHNEDKASNLLVLFRASCVSFYVAGSLATKDTGATKRSLNSAPTESWFHGIDTTTDNLERAAATALDSIVREGPGWTTLVHVVRSAFETTQVGGLVARAANKNDMLIAHTAADVAARSAMSSSAAFLGQTGFAGVRAQLFRLIRAELKNTRSSNFQKYAESPLWKDAPEIVEELYGKLLQKLRSSSDGFDYWASWLEMLWTGTPVDVSLLRFSSQMPPEIERQSAREINAYLKRLSLGTANIPVNRVRVIFIGPGGAGKTSLIRAIYGHEVVPGVQDMTPGVEIHEWRVPGTEIRADFWDFGGQVVAHATHQLFLRSRCLYVLVLDSRTETDAHEQAQYWLEHVRAFGGRSAILIVGNKCDLAEVTIGFEALKKRYNVAGFYSLSCVDRKRYGAKWKAFEASFVEQLRRLDTHQVLLGRAHFNVLQLVKEQYGTSHFLDRDAYHSMCNKAGIPSKGEADQEWFLDLLDKLGIVIDFRGSESFGSYLLEPRWLTHGIYTLLYSQAARDCNGHLKDRSVVEILSGADVRDDVGNRFEYTPKTCQFLIDAMIQFELCYRVSPGQICIPALFLAEEPVFNFPTEGSRLIVLKFQGFVPRQLMPRFVVRRHSDIVGTWVWQHGVYLQSAAWESSAVVRVDYHHREVTFLVNGGNIGEYLATLFSEVATILKQMPDLIWDAFVELPDDAKIANADHPRPRVVPDDGRRLAKYQDLLAHERLGMDIYVCEYGSYRISEVLRYVKRERPTTPPHGIEPQRPERAGGLNHWFLLWVLISVIGTFTALFLLLGHTTAVVVISLAVPMVVFLCVAALRHWRDIGERTFRETAKSVLKIRGGNHKSLDANAEHKDDEDSTK